jgi:hypothetical protein
MQFRQVNKNLGDVNNAISEKGDVVQAVGPGSKAELKQPKEGFWSMLWKKIKNCWAWLVG